MHTCKTPATHTHTHTHTQRERERERERERGQINRQPTWTGSLCFSGTSNDWLIAFAVVNFCFWCGREHMTDVGPCRTGRHLKERGWLEVVKSELLKENTRDWNAGAGWGTDKSGVVDICAREGWGR
jgi:hypothetical protein